MHDATRCQQQSCHQPVVTKFRSEPFCVEHFCGRCYQLLDHVDQSAVNDPASSITLEQALLADLCARHTIEICLNSAHLSNLDRARLLDILLWCGDISAAFRPEVREKRIAEYRAPYEKPQLRRRDAKAALCV